EVTWRESPGPARSTVRPEKRACPATAGRVSVPASGPPPDVLVSAAVTRPAKPVARLPNGSSAATAKLNGWPATTLAGGCTGITSCGAAPGNRVMGDEVTVVRPSLWASRTYPDPA